MRELQARARGSPPSAERERRRIERDLHDGAQQRLVALRIELELAEELVRRDPRAGRRAASTSSSSDVDEALEELRALAHGVYPPLLADRGLAEALRAVAARMRRCRWTSTRAAIGRYAPEVESAVYFCVLEALQNVLKHADGRAPRRRAARRRRRRPSCASACATTAPAPRRGELRGRRGHHEHARPASPRSAAS